MFIFLYLIYNIENEKYFTYIKGKQMIKGLVPACVTPLDIFENIDTEAVKMHQDYLLDCGVDGLLYCGTTGEFNCLSAEKRKILLETAVENNK